MDLDLSTNGSSIKDSINSLLKGKLSWVVLGYKGSNTLTVVETGDDSFEDMFEEFHGSKIMYGFANVTDPNSKLKKNVYIYWQGSGATQDMRTKSVQHSNIIRELCKPVHVTVTARDEQDLDLKDIMLKVAAASGSNYSFHNEERQIFETQPSVKSEDNTANMARKARQMELASLGSMKKEANNNHRDVTDAPKAAPSKEIKVVSSSTNFQKVGTNYTRTNPEKELQSLKTTQKTTFESAARIKSENNTAERAREERQKEDIEINNAELSSLTNRVFLDEPFQQVGTTYTKINPMMEIQRLRRESVDTDSPPPLINSNYTRCDPKLEITKLRKESITNDKDVPIMSTGSTYKKIDPFAEIQELRKTSKSSESNQCVSPSSNYKKINPSEEIKNLKSQGSFDFHETPVSPSAYKKVNPAEEINTAKKDYSYPTQNIVEKQSTERIHQSNEPITARMAFENTHKSKDGNNKRTSHEYKGPKSPAEPVKVQLAVEHKKVEVKEENLFNFEKNVSNGKLDNKVNPQMLAIATVAIAPVDVKKSGKKTVSAVAIYDYQANDEDEISFETDDVIQDIEKIDDGWWIGVNCAGKKGMFPSNYVELAANSNEPAMKHDSSYTAPDSIDTASVSHTNDSFANSLTVTAQYSYAAQDKDELSFNEGDMIYNVNKVDEGWWEGETKSGDRGLFPANYVVIS